MPPTKPKPAAPEGEIVRAIRERIEEMQRYSRTRGRIQPHLIDGDSLIEWMRQRFAEHAARAGAGKRGSK